MNDPRPLRPAQLEPEHVKPAYMPRIPWRWLLMVGIGASVVGGGLWLRERGKADALREQIVRVHTVELAEARAHYVALRDRIEAWAADAASAAPDDYIDPRLQLAKLGSGSGLYLRLPHRVAKDPEELRNAARFMGADSIGRCLGLAPASARGLFELGAFLDEGWIDEAKATNNVRRLKVIDDELARRIQRDLPSVMGLVKHDWFLLVLQHDNARAAAPVDVFLWDSRSGETLLRTRVKARGRLVSARFQAEGAPYAPRVEARETSHGADDCSIAAQIKALAGDGLATVTAPPAAAAAASLVADL